MYLIKIYLGFYKVCENRIYQYIKEVYREKWRQSLRLAIEHP